MKTEEQIQDRLDATRMSRKIVKTRQQKIIIETLEWVLDEVRKWK